MSAQLLIVDCDGTVSRLKNPFYAVADVLSCFDSIRAHADEYLAGRISYDELVSRQNPVFRLAGRRYANARGRDKLDRASFLELLESLIGDHFLSSEVVAFLDEVRSLGYQVAMISSGWEPLVARAARETRITYWRANEVLFDDGEFSGTLVHVRGDKIAQFESAIREFGSSYSDVFYFGDSEFDLIGMEFIHDKGGECLVHQSNLDAGVTFPAHVRTFGSLEHMEEYLRVRTTSSHASRPKSR
jgi:phosphoserine phosphatase